MKATPWEVDDVMFSFAYVAGFLDADGSIVATLEKNPPKYKRAYRPRLKINFSQKTSHMRMLKGLQKFLGCGTIRTNEKKQLSELVIADRFHSIRILENLLPHLVIKRSQAHIALEVLRLFGSNDKNNRIDDVTYSMITEKVITILHLNSSSGGKKSFDLVTTNHESD